MRHLLWISAVFCLVSSVPATDYDNPFHHWPLDLRIEGSIVIGDHLSDVEQLTDALTPAERGGKVALLVDPGIAAAEFIQFASVFRDADEFHLVRRDPDAGFQEVLRLLPDCRTFVWRSGAAIDPTNETSWSRLRGELQSFLSRGGTLVALGAAAESVAEFYLTDSAEGEVGKVAQGMGFLPDCLLEQAQGDHVPQAVLKHLERYPATVGITLDDNTLLRLSGRVFSVQGQAQATFLLAGGKADPAGQTQAIAARQSRRQPANDYLIDLTQWRRRAIDQLLEPFPPAQRQTPKVESGTLVIVGGGGMPAGLMSRFVELAGGAEAARLVYVPCSERRELPGDQATVRQWQRMGVKHATFIHTKDRMKANEDEEFLAALKDATGIWFGGGRQWNFADSYYGTKAQALMKKVLQRGGVVGGSSAGASIQAQFLARATPIENYRILAPGYLRGGMGFIQGVAIDQHFSQRSRQKDMSSLVDLYPQILGIGIDEATALIVSGSQGEIVGRGEVYFYDRTTPVPEDGPDYVKLAAGSVYDLDQRQVVKQVTPKVEDEQTPAEEPEEN
ncbi:MAG: cyanophycinase [Pirellulales bacterium]|nr:cyanophycinase [Pirellulales bacterium]